MDSYIPYIFSTISISLTAFGMIIVSARNNSGQFASLSSDMKAVKETQLEIKNYMKEMRGEMKQEMGSIRKDVDDLKTKVTEIDGRVKYLEKEN